MPGELPLQADEVHLRFTTRRTAVEQIGVNPQVPYFRGSFGRGVIHRDPECPLGTERDLCGPVYAKINFWYVSMPCLKFEIKRGR